MELSYPFQAVTGPLNDPHRVISINDTQYIAHKTLGIGVGSGTGC